MGLETGTFLDDLVTSNPDGATDDTNKGDDHLRLIKSVLKTTFPNATKAFRFESVLTKTTTYPVVAADARALILGDASSGAFTITLPLGSTVFAGYTILIMKSDSSGDAVTVDGNGAETINGSLTRSLATRYQGEKYTWDGSEWKVVSITKVGTSDLENDSVTFAKMQNITTARLLGRTTAASGDTEEISVDGTMDLSSVTLGVAAAGIDTAQLATSAVETAKINDLAVTTAKIAANSVNGSKIALGSDAQGDVMYYNGTDWVRLAKGTDGMFLKQGATIPAWALTGATVVIKTSDETVNNSTTLQNDNDLVFALVANTTYVVDVVLLLNAANATPDFKFGWTVPASCTMFWEAVGTNSWVDTGTKVFDTESDTDTVVGIVGTNGVIYRCIVRNGANAGNLQLRWAQNSAHASNNKVLKHSHLTIRNLGAT